MISINCEGDWIEDSEYNIVDHMDNRDTDIISMKQETSEVIHIGDMVASIEDIKEVIVEHATSETIYTSSDFYEESIEGDVEVEVFDQSSAISRSIDGLD